uniref:Uncharacterized protein n=1 Tax=Panagrolaimus sp. ES5 TaxID=591445 RepID=A0AC34GHD0_9BILA
LWHGKIFTTKDDNEVNSKIVFKRDNELFFGKIIQIYKNGNVLQAQVEIFSTRPYSDCLTSKEKCNIEGANEKVEEIKSAIFTLLNDHIRLKADSPNTVISINADDIIGHCLQVSFDENTFYFNLAMKAECK